MFLDNVFPREVKQVKENNIPLVICGGTVEYHGPHCSYGCDTLVAQGLIEKLAERKNCDTWDAENVHLADVKLKKGVNRVLLRLTRVNADAKYNLFFSKRATCGEHYTDLSATRPEFF
jgi:hypothetical protein